MGKISDAAFVGASGEKYRFETFTLDSKFENVGAVFLLPRLYTSLSFCFKS
jgi:hypothetical protein